MVTSYNEKDIVVTKGLEGLRLRPAMYIGNLENGRFSILKEILDNALDEATSGFSKKVGCILYDDGKDSCLVYDEGRGIPVGPHPDDPEKSTMEIVFTQLHAGGKLKKGAYSSGSVGTHGIGSSATNALSDYFQAWTFRDGKWYTQTYSKGIPTSKVTTIPSTKLPVPLKKGTIVKFTPDSSILKKRLDVIQVSEYMENCSFLNSGVIFELTDIKGNLKTFKSKGLIDFVKKITSSIDENGESTEKFENLGNPFIFSNEQVDIALQWFESDDSNLTSWVNSNKTIEGGTHLNGLIRLITTSFGDFAKKKNYKPEDLRVGLYGGLNIKIAEPQFDSQTKEKLINPEADKMVFDILRKDFLKYLEKNKSFVKRVIDRANEMRSIYNKFANEKKALSKIKTRGKQALPPPSKFIISNCKDDSLRELMICLSGDTEILDVRGRSFKIRDLAENQPNEFYGFGVDEQTKEIRPTKLWNFRKTRENAELVRVHLDNDTYFDCTPDHRILCKDSKNGKFNIFYTEAKDLKPKQSLVNLTLIESDSGYLGFYQPVTGYTRCAVHQKVYDYYVGSRNSKIDDIHHKNEIKYDNYPSNLVKLSHSDHSAKHGVLTEYWQDPMHRAKQSEVVRKYFKNPIIKKKHSEKMKEVMKNVDFTKIKQVNSELRNYRASKKLGYFKQRTFEEFSKYQNTGTYYWKHHYNMNLLDYFINQFAMDSYFSKHSFDFEEFYNKTNKIREKERLLQIGNACISLYGKLTFKLMQEYCRNEKIQVPLVARIKRYFENEEILEKEARVYNHKVVSVEFLTKHEDVYCCNSDTHNFFLKNGICVHNCEGDSAGGSARQARNPYYQEILKLRGKILNTAKAQLSKVYESADIINILKALGFDPVNKEHRCRVGKVIFLTDADVDGEHISTLLLTLIKMYYPELLEQGKVFAVDAPLFIGKTRTKTIYGEDYQDLVKKAGNEKIQSVTRLKGWGEANAELLHDLAFNPNTRKLIRIKDVSGADFEYFKKIVGEDSEVRKQLLESL